MKSREFRIGNHPVGMGHPCFVIAEIGSNHNHDFDLARRMIDVAASCGVDAVKFQTFKADQHYSRKTPGFGYLQNANTFELIKSLEIDRSWHAPLKAHAEQQGVEFMSSPCDPEAVAELRELGMSAYKVASFDLPDTDLIRLMARTGKPVILSTGMADWMDIERGVAACRDEGNDNVALLQCTSLYPAPAQLSNLRAMDSMRAAFNCVVGYSDHTMGEHIPLAAAALGASIIEKHFTLDRSMPGPDHPFAMQADELKLMVQRLRELEIALGDGAKAGPRVEEMEMFNKGRRSIHARVDIPKGTIIADEMLAIKRPGLGISPSLRGEVVGRVARSDIEADQWIAWEMI